MVHQSMGAAKKLNYKKLLRDLVPINALSESHIDEVKKKADIEDLRSGRYVFRKGDRDYQSVYLLDGTVELISDSREEVTVVSAGSELGLHPLAHKQPREVSARAKGKVTVARIDSRLLDVLLTWDESAGYDVVEIDAHDDDDWMTRMLQSQAFLQLPPSNIHQLLMRLESVDVNAGDVIIRQDDEGDYFYIVKNGRLRVSRKTSSKGKEVVLAELGEGACFGEEALVSETKRNATVTMVTDGLLMRLSKDDFNELLRAPLVHEADFAEAEALVSKGAQWLDVRLPGEFENRALKGSINLPLSALRDESAELDTDITYVVCCDTGRRSSAGAFVLSQRGLNVYTLKNGLMDVPDEALTKRSVEEPVKHESKDAEIIPFETDIKPSAESGELSQQSPGDSAHINKLHSQLQAAERRLDEQSRAAEQDKARLQNELNVAQQALEDRQRQLDAAEGEKKALEEDKERLQQTLSQARETADGRESAMRNELGQMAERLAQLQQEHDGRSGEWEEKLSQLRHDHSELCQHNSELAGERDAAIAELEKAKRDLASQQEQLVVQQTQASAELASLKEELEQQIGSAVERADSSQSRIHELEAQLSDQGQTTQELDQSLQATAAQLTESNERNAELQTQVDDQSRLLEQQQSEREDLERRLTEAQQSLEQAIERERQIEAKLDEGQGSSSQIQKALDDSIAEAGQLRARLDQSEQQYAESEKKVAELRSRLNSIEAEHASDIASLREAVTRAQDERENISREQRRLMSALRKAERDLERARQDNETEVYRLQKELKESAGESNTGLAALREQLEQAGRERDELEIQLGERSAQMENALAKAEKLDQQLKQAQDSARQAEQQLIESNQTANEEMTIRLDAEQQSQRALREQLEAVTLERNNAQEQLTVQNHELEELRIAVQEAQARATANEQSTQVVQEAAGQLRELQELRVAVSQLEQARDEARNLQRLAQQDVDQLRAEAEVSRGLVNMQASVANSDEALHAELVEGKKNVEVAVRLRIQAEEKAAGLQQEVDRLQLELSRSRANASVNDGLASIATLGANNPQTAAAPNPELNNTLGAASNPQDNASLTGVGTRLYETEPETAEAKNTATTKRLLLLLMLALAAAAGYWWFGHSPSAGWSTTPLAASAETPEVLPAEDAPIIVDEPKTNEPAPPAEAPRRKKDKAKVLPSFIKGMPDSTIPLGTEKQVDADIKQPDKVKQSEPAATQGIKEASENLDKEAPPAQVKPLRSFSDNLKIGGSGPVVVEFRADSFAMGSSATSANFTERPRHPVKLKGFAIGKHEITFKQYDQFAQATGRLQPSSAGWGRGNRPVIHVSWEDAVAYTRWLSEQTGNTYRLPTEAEWEYVARSGNDKLFWWGNEVGEAHANCYDCGTKWSGKETAPVGSFTANTFAVHDMAGNVMEWVQDCYRPGYEGAPDDGSAVEFVGCAARVVRGGGFDSPADLLRSASRSQRSPESRLDDLGFRVVREIP